MQILTLAYPPKCLPRDCFIKKFISHLDSQELRDVGVDNSQFSCDSFRLEGIKFMDQNKAVHPNFNYRPNPSVKIDATFPIRRSLLDNPNISRPSVVKLQVTQLHKVFHQPLF